MVANALVGTTEIHEKQVDEQETQNIMEPGNPAGKEKESEEALKCSSFRYGG